MMKEITWKKILILGALLIAPLVLAQCGEVKSVASKTYGPEGPTYPSGLYFKVVVAPYAVQTNSSAHTDVQVWDSNGNAAAGVNVAISGGDTVDDDNYTVTGENGQTGWIWEIKGNAGSVMYFTVTVEDKQITAPIQIVPSVGSSEGA